MFLLAFAPQVARFSLYFLYFFVVFSDPDFHVSVSWSLVYRIKGKPELRVETAVVNASSYKDLLSIDNLVNSRLVPEASKEMSGILDQMKKRGHIDCALSSSSAPSKKSQSSKAISPVQALHLPSSGESEDLMEKSSAYELAPSAPSRTRSKFALQSQASDLLSSFQKDFDKFVKYEIIAKQNDRHAPKLCNTMQRCIY